MRVSKTQVAQVVPFAVPVSDLSRDLERLIVELDGFAWLAQIKVSKPKVAQVDFFHF